MKLNYKVKKIFSFLLCVTLLLTYVSLSANATEAATTLSVTFDPNGGDAIDPITVTSGEKYGRLPSSAVTGLSGGDSNWYLVDEDGNVTDTKITKTTTVALMSDHALFVKRNVLAPTLKITLSVPGAISDNYQYYVPGDSQRILTVTVNNQNTDILDYTYQWYKDGVAITGATEETLTLDGYVSDSGTYTVKVTATLKDGTGIIVTTDTASAEIEQKVKIMHASNTLYYDANGGEGGPSSNYTGGTTIAVAKGEPTRTGYSFVGWNTEADETGENYTSGASYTFIDDNGNGGCEVTLYAKWTPDVQAVYDAYSAVQDALSSNKMSELKTAAEGFEAVLDAYNDLSEEQFEELGTLLDATSEEVFGMILSDWINTNIIFETEKLYQAYLDNPNAETAVEFTDYYDEIFNNPEYEDEVLRELVRAFILDIDEVYNEALDNGANEICSIVFMNGEKEFASITCPYGKTLGIANMPVPVKEGYTFAGWYTKDGLRVEHGITVTGDLIAYATWEEDESTPVTPNEPDSTPEYPESPKTGDNTNLGLWFALLFVSGVGLIGTSLYGKRKKAADK